MTVQEPPYNFQEDFNVQDAPGKEIEYEKIDGIDQETVLLPLMLREKENVVVAPVILTMTKSM